MNLLPKGHMMIGMATCHSLTIIDGVLSGDPLELIMFNSLDWVSIYLIFKVFKYTYSINISILYNY